MKARVLLLFALTILATALVVSQPLSLRGSSGIELNFGLWSESKASQQISAAGIQQSAKTSGFVGGLTYCYWLRENLALTVSGALLSSEATSKVTAPTSGGLLGILSALGSTQQNSNSVFSLLGGVRYYVLQLEPDDIVRPYLSVAAGAYKGFEAKNSLSEISAHSESAFGGKVGAGLDVFLGGVIKLGANVGYNVMADFQNPVGTRSNFNGFDASMGIGFVF